MCTLYARIFFYRLGNAIYAQAGREYGAHSWLPDHTLKPPSVFRGYLATPWLLRHHGVDFAFYHDASGCWPFGPVRTDAQPFQVNPSAVCRSKMRSRSVPPAPSWGQATVRSSPSSAARSHRVAPEKLQGAQHNLAGMRLYALKRASES